MDDDTVLRLRKADLTWTPSDDGEVMVLDHRESRYLAITASGAPLWEALTGGATRSALAEALEVAWGLEPARARADVDEFLTMLTERGLLEPER